MVSRTFHTEQESPANALDVSPDNQSVVIAGRTVFKIYFIGEFDFTERFNLRSGRNINLNFSCNDVVWNQLEESYLATAATNGAVVIWDINKSGKSKQIHVFQEHKRTVNKVNFNPLDANLLISGSQDAVIKMFDLRGMECTGTFSASAESIRDVQFSPHNQHQFASVAENGRVSIWDCRRPDKCEKSWTAHAENIFACDWHPEIRNWLATAGRDKTVKIWKTEEKPILDTTIHTLGPVGKIKWRPGKRAHIASASLALDFDINVWDIRRPYVPMASFEEHKDVTTGIVWRAANDTLLSTSRDATLYQHAFPDALRPSDRANPAALAINIHGDIAFACRNYSANLKTSHGSTIDREPPAVVSGASANSSQGNLYNAIPQPPPLPPLGVNVPSAGAATSTSFTTATQPLSSVTATMPVAAPIATASSSGAASILGTSIGGQQQQQQQQQSGAVAAGSFISSSMVQHQPVRNPSSVTITTRLPSAEKVNKKMSIGGEKFRAARSILNTFMVNSKKDAFTSTCEDRHDTQEAMSLISEPIVDAITSTDWFVYSAKNYWLTGRNLAELCDHNAAVASALNRRQIAMSWLTLKTLFGYFNFDLAIKAVVRPSANRSGHGGVHSKGKELDKDNRARHGSNRLRHISGVNGLTREEASSMLISGGHGGLRSRNVSQQNSGLDSNSDSENENGMTLTNIARGQLMESDCITDFFGDSELTTVGIEHFVHTDQNTILNGSMEWNLHAEGFELRHEIKDSTSHDEASSEQGLLNGVQSASQEEQAVKSVTVEDQANSLLRVNDVQLYSPWSPDEIIKDTLIHHAESGDIQSTVSMYLVLGHQRLKTLFQDKTVEFWFNSYIDLLHRFRLINQAAMVIQLCPNEAINNLSMISTTYYSNCSSCSKALNRSQGAWFCDRCKSFPNRCSLCHKIVRGLFAWCQGCNHGGHVHHINTWTKNHKQCPAGCGHYCQYQ